VAKVSEYSDKVPKKRPPARTLEARENQMTAKAFDLAEKQLEQGTASSQIITEFLKRGSTKEKLEKEILEKKRDLLVAQTEAIKSQKRVEELYGNALNAMRSYAGAMAKDDDDE